MNVKRAPNYVINVKNYPQYVMNVELGSQYVMHVTPPNPPSIRCVICTESGFTTRLFYTLCKG